MGYWHWGSNLADDTYFESHEGVRLEVDKIEFITSNTFCTTGNNLVLAGTNITKAGLEIKTLPVLTFEIRNGYNATSDSVAAKYITSVMAQRKMFIGGIQRVEFDTGTVATSGSSLLLGSNTAKQCTINVLPKNLDRLLYSNLVYFLQIIF